jgi:hypothetical protein
MGKSFTEEVNPAGQPMEWSMPRWMMNGADMDDLLEYLNSLP